MTNGSIKKKRRLARAEAPLHRNRHGIFGESGRLGSGSCRDADGTGPCAAAS